jgi:hypothetical protein
MISRISTFTSVYVYYRYIETKIFTLNIMIADDYSVCQKQKNVESDHFI